MLQAEPLGSVRFNGVEYVPAAPDAEEWETQFDDKFGILLDWGHGDSFSAQDFKSFIGSVIEQAEKKYKERLINARLDSYEFGKKDALATVSEAIGKLRKNIDRRPEKVGWTFMDERDEAHNAALDAILKVLHEV